MTEECRVTEEEITRILHRFELLVSVLRSVARRRLLMTENPIACANVKCKIVYISDSAVLIVIKRL
jgi:hypothetical protein